MKTYPKTLILLLLVLLKTQMIFPQWVQTNGPYGSEAIYCLAVSGTNIFAGTSDYGVYLSTNNGTNWTQVNNGLTNTTILALTVNGTNIIAGTNVGGVYISTNNGTKWTQANNGLTNFNVRSFTFSGNNIFAGTFGSGVWRRPLSELVSVSKEVNDLPQDYTLCQNYPNPFNPTTTISYRLKENGYVKLMVYDTKGSLIKVLVNGTKDPGYYETEFNAKGLASGIYFYRIEVFGKGSTSVFSEMKKTVLLK
jgi:Secretion system C-terminal sorting domain